MTESSSKESSKATGVNNTVLWVTYLNVTLYAMCYQLQRPVEPFLIKSLSEQAGDAESVSRTYGNLQSFFQTVQMIGSPLVGILLDRIGIRYTSAVVFLASALSYGILAVSFDLQTLFFSKIPTVLQAAVLVAQATAATTTGTDVAARAAALGRMTTAYAVGATLGPALGGYLADQGDFYIGAKLAVVGSLLSVVLSLVFLPNETQKAKTTSSDDGTLPPLQKKRSFIEELRRSGEIAARSSVWPLLMVKVLSGVGASMHSTALPLVLTQQLNFEPSQLGMSMSGSMLAVAAFGAVGMAPLTKWLGPPGMTHSGLLGRAVFGCVMAALVSTAAGYSDTILMQIVAVSILHALASHTLATGLTVQTTGGVGKHEQGALLGLEHSLFSLARIGGPTLGTTFLEWGAGLWSVETACGSLDVVLVVVLMATATRTTKRKSP